MDYLKTRTWGRLNVAWIVRATAIPSMRMRIALLNVARLWKLNLVRLWVSRVWWGRGCDGWMERIDGYHPTGLPIAKRTSPIRNRHSDANLRCNHFEIHWKFQRMKNWRQKSARIAWVMSLPVIVIVKSHFKMLSRCSDGYELLCDGKPFRLALIQFQN